jgi:intracellular multiplication protein IcmO
MALDERKYSYGLDHALRDTRPLGAKLYDWFSESDNAAITLFFLLGISLFFPIGTVFIDVLFIIAVLYTYWLYKIPRKLPYKMPAHSKFDDPNNTGGGRGGKSEGIMFLGNCKASGEEVWFTNSDIRTHILYLGTTGSGKTEGLKSMVTNAMAWGSGFVYIDGKADTDLWSSLSSLCRRFGRDDDLLVLNYMTGNSDEKAPSNSMNPFSSGSASYLTNMLVSLMPAAEGDNAMWKERAVSLLGSLMPALTYMRDNHDMPLSVSSIRRAMNFPDVVKLSRNESLPPKLREGIKGYLDTLPGYVDEAFDDNGQDKPLGPDTPQTDTQVPKQQHGYLTMQFTRSLQSLGDDYGYIFDVANADVDMIDVVLNRRILVVLIPALEKSSDETANLGKIVAATLKGMMGSTLGSTVEGDTSTVIENKPTHSATPFMTVFDEVGYYATDGMAVMAAQARSLGFALVYAAQDLPALEKRVKEEARSITANCNIKIFGKLEDPTQTKDFFEKTIGKAIVTQVSGYNVNAGSLTGSFDSQQQASVTFYDRISYDAVQEYKEGEAGLYYANVVNEINVFYSNPGHAKAMRVQKLLGFEKTDDYVVKNLKNIAALRDRLAHKTWTAANADVKSETEPDMQTVIDGLQSAAEADLTPVEQGAMALAHLYATQNPDALKKKDDKKTSSATDDKSEGSGDKKDLSWEEIMGGGADDKKDSAPNNDQSEESKTDEREEGEKETSSSGSSDSQSPTKIVANADYNVEDAIAEKAESGTTILPENLSDDVKNILKSAADTLTAGLFSPPTLDKYAQGGEGDSKGFKAKTISPNQQPGKTGR